MESKKLSKIIEFPESWFDSKKFPTPAEFPKDSLSIYNATKHSVEYLKSLKGPVNRSFVLSEWE